MSLTDLTERAMEIRVLYAQLEERRYGTPWTVRDLVLGFVGDVGELAQLVQAAAGTRSFTGDLSDALKHELADCLWSVLVIAKELDVDLASAFDSTMNELNERVAAQLEAS